MAAVSGRTQVDTPPMPAGQPSPVHVRLIGSTVVDKKKAFVTYSVLAMSKRTTHGGGSDILSPPSEAGVSSVLVQRRFKEFVALRSRLAPLARQSKVALPPLPAKTLQRSAAAAFTAKRQEQLQLWLKQVAATLWCVELELFLGLATEGGISSSGRPEAHTQTQSPPRRSSYWPRAYLAHLSSSSRRSSYWPKAVLSYFSGRFPRDHVRDDQAGTLAALAGGDAGSAADTPQGRLIALKGSVGTGIGGTPAPSLMLLVSRLWRVALASDDATVSYDPTDDIGLSRSSISSIADTPPAHLLQSGGQSGGQSRGHRRSSSWSPSSPAGAGGELPTSPSPAVPSLTRSSSSSSSGNGAVTNRHRRAISNGSRENTFFGLGSFVGSAVGMGSMPSVLESVEPLPPVRERRESRERREMYGEGPEEPEEPEEEEAAEVPISAPSPTSTRSDVSSAGEASSPSVKSHRGEASSPSSAVDASGLRLELRLGPFLEAVAQTLMVVDKLGPFWLAVKNDQANTAKMHTAWTRLGKGPAGAISTLRELLAAELASGVHGFYGPYSLADPSSAIALVWLRRSLTFLCHVLEGVRTDRRPGSVTDFGRAAYKVELEPLHPWFIRKIFTTGFGAMPTREEFLRRLAPNWRPEHGEECRQLELLELVEALAQGLKCMNAHLSAFGMRTLNGVSGERFDSR